MKTQLLIPSKIKVGFNLRPDTYTGKLGYVIMFDGKKWRKETSWEGWRQKEGQEVGYYENNQHTIKKLGSEINPIEFENEPTEGFVLNKKAGGGSSGWNHRATYCRVYDPRGFEFEISIPNLLFILQETSSFKGKGLEGEFVYSWEGKDLVLLPAGCEEYKQSTNFTKLQDGKIGVKDLVPGCSYKTKRQKDWIYLGKFNYYSLDYVKGSRHSDKQIKLDKFQIFVNETGEYEALSSLSNLAAKNNDTPVSNYAELMDGYSKSKFAAKPTGLTEAPKSINFKEDSDNGYGNYLKGKYYVKKSDGVYNGYTIYSQYDWVGNYGDSNRKRYLKGYSLYRDSIVKFNNDIFAVGNSWSRESDKMYSQEEIEAMNFKELFVTLESGNKVKAELY